MARLWAQSSITLLDVRCRHIDCNKPLLNYHMPTSIQVFVSGGKANVQLNHTVYAVDRFAVLHGGKGTKLSLWALDDSVNMFMALYKAELPAKRSEEAHSLMKQSNPFDQQFAYVPGNPLLLKSLFQQMLEHWLLVSPLEQLHAKTLLYQTVREVYHDLRTYGLSLLQPDPVSSTKRYLDEHYMNPVLFEAIADMFAISRGQLTRLFKRRFGVSLQEYVTVKRLKAASDGLLYSNATIKEVAMSCGMVEELNLIRLFKKYYRMTPSEYRNKKIAAMHDCDIDNDSQYLYNEKGLDDIVKFQPMENDANKETRTIRTVKGDIEVPADPQRVVAQYLMGDVVALGIKPVGISDVYDGAAFAEQVEDITVLEWMPDWDGEDVMKLQPDLIIVIGEDYVDKLAKIAPTVLVPLIDLTQDERIAFMGEVLNRQEAAAAAIEEYRAAVETAKSNLEQAGFDNYTVSVFEGGADETMHVLGDKYGAGGVAYASLGLRAPETVQSAMLDQGISQKGLSFDVLADYSGDFIIRNSYDGMADLSNDTIWNSLEAVQNHRVAEIKFGLNYYTDIYSTIAQIHTVSSELLKRLEETKN